MTAAAFKTIQDHVELLHALTTEEAALRDRIAALEQILVNLNAGYNPNYQDMAVLEAVRGWEQLKPAEKGEPAAEGEGETEEQVEEEEAEEVWTDERIKELKATDPLSVLLEHERHVAGPAADEVTSARKLSLFVRGLYHLKFLTIS